MANELLALAYDQVDTAKAQRLRDCATCLTFAMVDGRKVLTDANFCRVRLCPMCAWRRSLKLYSQVLRIVQAESRRPDARAYLLLTLTLRNVRADQLADTLDAMMRGWGRLVKARRVNDAIKGWYRGMEITHNVNPLSQDYDTYHPHFHALLAVSPRYFKDRIYIPQAEWGAMWRKAARLDYDPVIDVRRVKGTTAAAVAEVAKYAVKGEDYIIPDDWDLTVATVALLDQALANRRFAAFGGELAELHRQLDLDDAEDGDLTHVDDDQADYLDEAQRISFWWFSGYRQYYGL